MLNPVQPTCKWFVTKVAEYVVYHSLLCEMQFPTFPAPGKRRWEGGAEKEDCIYALSLSSPLFRPFISYPFRLCHDVTPLEENKSFLEKVRLGGLLCGLHEDSIKALTRNNEVAAAVLAASANLEVENPLTVLSCQQQYRKQQGQNGASPRRRQYQQLQTQPHQNGHRMQGRESIGKFRDPVELQGVPQSVTILTPPFSLA